MNTYQARPFATSFFRLTFAYGMVVLLLAVTMSAHAQSANTPEQGFLPSRSYAMSDLEMISLEGGNLMMQLPLGSLPAGRGGMSHGLNLVYNSKIWKTYTQSVPCQPGVNCSPELPNQHEFLQLNPEANWRYGFQYKLMLVEREYTPPFGQQNYNVCDDPYAVNYYQLKVSFPDGSLHTFRLHGQTEENGYFGYKPDGSTKWSQCAIPAPQTGTMTYYTIDGTYLRLDVQHDADTNWQNNPWTLYFPDGGRVTGGNSPQRIYDRNNNYVEVQSVANYNGTGHAATRLVDQLGRSVDLEYNTAASQDTVRFKGFGGEDVALTVKWKTITVNKPYFTGVATMNMSKSFRVLDQVVMPAQSGGLAYTFGYNAGTANPSVGWGELSSVTLPSGATATYQYDRDGESNIHSVLVLQDYPTRKDLTYQREYDGTSTPVTETWLYSIDEFTGQVTAPDGGVSREHFGLTGYIGKVAYKSERPDGTVIERRWANNVPKDTPNSEEGDVNNYVPMEYTSIRNAAGALSETAIKTFKYDKNGNLTEVKEYDWVDYSTVHDTSGNPTWSVTGATLKRTTLNTYNSPTPDATDKTTDDPDSYHKPTSPRLRNAVASTEAKAGATTVVSRAEFTYDSATTTGNLTKQTGWDSTKGAYSNPLAATNSISVSHQYDAYGNRTITTDAKGVQSKLVYGAVGGYTGLYPTENYSALGTTVQRKTTRVYDFNTGLVTTTTDMDNNVSSTTDYDVFGRPTLATAAVGKPEETRTATEYSAAARRVVVRQDLDVTTTGVRQLVSVRHYDQLGRIRLTRQLEDPAAQTAEDETEGIKVQTRYAFSGSNSYQLVSNPYRAATSGAAGTEATMGWTRTKSDNGGRVLEVKSYSGSGLPAPWGANATTTGAVTTAYDGVSTTVTDQMGKNRQSTTDALNNLVQVVEDPGGLGYITDYVYDALGNLKTVTQAGLQNDVQVTQTRTFTYDSLSRLASATNPESGTIQYKYDANGNLVLKIDPRSGGASLPNCSVPYSGTKIATCYEYDALNRATLRDYGDATPDVRYYYDAQVLPAGAPTFVRGSSEGRLVAVLTGGTNAGTYYGYDTLGRALRRIQRTDSVNYLSEATYNKASATLTETYPAVPGATDRRVVSYTYDAAGRLSALASGATTYAPPGASVGLSSVTYTAHGALDKETLGNGLVHDIIYNRRLQPTQIRLGTAGAPTSMLNLAYNYGTTANNGNVLDVTEKIGAWTAKQVYTYDALNRLDTATETNGSTTTWWTEDDEYDRWGNRWEVNAGDPSLTFNAKNQIAGYTYDLAGNITNDTVHTYVYDAENRIKTVHGETDVYVYDGEGKRVKKDFSLGEQVRFVYGVGGQVVAEFDAASGAWKKEYVYGAGNLVATIEPGVGTKYTTADHLGSPRVVTSNTGTLVSRHDYRPFGQELADGDSERTAAQGFGVQDALRQKFTQKERDGETGLDYFGARYYSSTQGRFTSPDEPFNDQWEHDPQSWNLYTYVRNNPLQYIDPTGEAKWVVGEDGQEHYVGDYEGEYDKDLNATWDGTNWDFHENNGQNNTVRAPSSSNSSWLPLLGSVVVRSPTPPHAKGAGLVIIALAYLVMKHMPLIGPAKYWDWYLERMSYIPPPPSLPGFPNAKRVRGKTPVPGVPGKKRARWEDDDYIYEWDYQHGTVEKWSKNGKKHLGEFDADTGERTAKGDPDPSRRPIDP